MAKKLIGYVRVSTQKQGQSGLGLDAQLTAIANYAKGEAGEVVQTYREVESGRNDARPELAKAIAHAKRVKGRLVIAKLDRLARKLHFITSLEESGVDFVACDNPNANRLTVHILAAVAQDEAERIRQRTRDALAAAKARGALLGSSRPGHWDGREDRRQEGAAKGSEAAAAKRRAESAPVYAEAAKIVARLRDEGASLREIAEELNAAGLTTVKGGAWSAMQVSRLIAAGFAPAVAAVAVGIGAAS